MTHAQIGDKFFIMDEGTEAHLVGVVVATYFNKTRVALQLVPDGCKHPSESDVDTVWTCEVNPEIPGALVTPDMDILYSEENVQAFQGHTALQTYLTEFAECFEPGEEDTFSRSALLHRIQSLAGFLSELHIKTTV